MMGHALRSSVLQVPAYSSPEGGAGAGPGRGAGVRRPPTTVQTGTGNWAEPGSLWSAQLEQPSPDLGPHFPDVWGVRWRKALGM